MDEIFHTDRRKFVKTLAGGAILNNAAASAPTGQRTDTRDDRVTTTVERITYPRVFSGRQLSQIAFPLGGIGTGCISLGGRGQLRDWEIYNRPDKGRSPEYAFAAICLRKGSSKPIAHVLEAELLPPYSSASGLGPANAPGLSRLQGASFTGEFPIANVRFHDARLPLQISLEAFSPFVPLDPDASGCPVAILSYKLRNTADSEVTASIAFSLDNPTGGRIPGSVRPQTNDSRVNEF